jgi:hypothetical protein
MGSWIVGLAIRIPVSPFPILEIRGCFRLWPPGKVKGRSVGMLASTGEMPRHSQLGLLYSQNHLAF